MSTNPFALLNPDGEGVKAPPKKDKPKASKAVKPSAPTTTSSSRQDRGNSARSEGRGGRGGRGRGEGRGRGRGRGGRGEGRGGRGGRGEGRGRGRGRGGEGRGRGGRRTEGAPAADAEVPANVEGGAVVTADDRGAQTRTQNRRHGRGSGRGPATGYDRKSRSGKSKGTREKRDGHGAGNFGSDAELVKDAKKEIEDNELPAELRPEATEEAPVEQNEPEEPEEPEEEDNTVTVSDYFRSQKTIRAKPTVSKVNDNKDVKMATVLVTRDEEEELVMAPKEKKQQQARHKEQRAAARKHLDLGDDMPRYRGGFDDDRRGRGRGRGRGGRGGRGRGEGRGGRGRGEGRGRGAPPPRLQDASSFPALA